MGTGGDPLKGAGLAAVGAFFAAIGWVLATDFRGFTTWHTQTTLRMMAPFERAVSRVPPWRWMNHAPDVMQRRQLRLEKFIGIVFIAVGAICAVGGVGVMFLGD